MTFEEKKNALIERVTALSKGPDMDRLQEIKNVLNKTFGEENNQIVKEGNDIFNIGPIVTEIGKIPDRVGKMYDVDWLYNQYMKPKMISPYRIVVFFPEVTIRNEKESHQIHELWIRFPLRNDGTLGGGMEGTRSAATVEEFVAGYMHSHLHTGYHNFDWRNFCLGSGPLAQLIPSLNNAYDIKIFEMTCLSIKNYVAWESISGTPYTYMANCRNRQGEVARSINEATKESYIKIVWPWLKKNVHILNDLNVKLEDDRFSVTLTDNMEKKIADYCANPAGFPSEYRYTSFSGMFCVRNTDGKYVSDSLANIKVPNIHKPVLTFKGKDVFFKLLNEEKNVTPQKYLNPVLKRELEVRLSIFLNKNIARFCGTKASHTVKGDTKTAVAS